MRLPLLACSILILVSACYNDNNDDLYPNGANCDSVNITYAQTIRPLMNSKCATAGCHDAATQGGGHDLSTYEGTKSSVSRMKGAVMWENGYAPMPKGANKLSSCEITHISKWIDAGAPNN